MHTITPKVPEELNSRLEKEDYYDALAILAHGEETYTLEDIEKELGLDN